MKEKEVLGLLERFYCGEIEADEAAEALKPAAGWDPEEPDLPTRLGVLVGDDGWPRLVPIADTWADAQAARCGYREAASAYNREREEEDSGKLERDLFKRWRESNGWEFTASNAKLCAQITEDVAAEVERLCREAIDREVQKGVLQERARCLGVFDWLLSVIPQGWDFVRRYTEAARRKLESVEIPRPDPDWLTVSLDPVHWTAADDLPLGAFPAKTLGGSGVRLRESATRSLLIPLPKRTDGPVIAGTLAIEPGEDWLSILRDGDQLLIEFRVPTKYAPPAEPERCEWPGCNLPALCRSGNFQGRLVCSEHFSVTNGGYREDVTDADEAYCGEWPISWDVIQDVEGAHAFYLNDAALDETRRRWEAEPKLRLWKNVTAGLLATERKVRERLREERGQARDRITRAESVLRKAWNVGDNSEKNIAMDTAIKILTGKET